MIVLAAGIPASGAGATVVKNVKIEGNQRIEDDAILRVIQTRPGIEYDPSMLSQDLESIYAMGYFDDVRVEVEESDAGNTVIFVVKEKPTIRQIKITGNTVFDEEKIKENIDISEGSILNIFKVKRNIKMIESLYKEKNYHNVKVTYKIEPLKHNQANLDFNIVEGEKIRIKKITFDGNSAYDADTLKGIMNTSERGWFSWLTGSGELDSEQLQQDVSLLTDFYQNNGYATARVAEPEVKFKKDGIYINIKINEGPRFKMGTVQLTGDFIVPESELRSKLGILNETYYNRSIIRQDVLNLTDIYADRGYAKADVYPEIKEHPEEKTIDLTYHIKKNQPIYFEKIVISGNTKTRDKVIRRELDVFEQELYSSRRLKRSIQNLYRLDYFNDIKVKTLPGTKENNMILQLDVEEKPTGTFSFGGGYSGVDKLYAMASISERNFLGRGQYMELKVQAGGSSRQYAFDFTEPWLFDIPLSAGINAYKWERDYDEYDRDSTGGGLSFGYPLFDYTRGYIKYTYDDSKIDNLSEEISPFIEAGRYTESSVSLSMVYDSRNRMFNPTEGSRHQITLQYAGLGGNVGFTKIIGETGWYFPLFWGTVGYLHGEAGYVKKNPGMDLPDYERFYLGGINSLRGFNWREVTPRTKTGIEIGGTEYVQFNAEYLFPIIKNAGLMGLVFFDAGNAWADEGESYPGLRRSAGFGIRWYSPMGPLRLERGYILDRKPGEGSGRWEFTVGGAF